MADRVLNANLVITAEDKTGKVLTDVATKLTALSKIGRIAGTIDGFQQAERSMTKVGTAIDKATRSLQEFDRASKTAATAAKFDSTERALQNVARRARDSSHEVKTLSANLKTLAGTAGVLVAEKAMEKAHQIAHATLETYRDFDKEKRALVAFGSLNPAEEKQFVDQAIHLGATTRYNDVKVLHAQKELVGRGVKKEFVPGFINELVNYGQAMDVDLATAAKTLESIIFSTNQNIEHSSDAAKTMRHTIDVAVKAAKLGGLSNEDIAQSFKFGGASGTAAGLSYERMAALTAAIHRAGYRGDEGGVLVRAIASKLVSPNKKALEALQAGGINFDSYTTMPGGLSTDNLSSIVSRRFGKTLSTEQRKKLDTVLNDPNTVADREKFIASTVPILESSFGKGRNGKVRAGDAQKVAKMAADFYKLSVESVDTNKLFMDILEKKMNIGLLNSVFTTEHGGKVAALSQKLDVFKDTFDKLSHVDTGFAENIGEQRMSGFDGAVQRLDGSVKNLETAIGRAWDKDGKGGELTLATNALASVTQHIAELDANSLKAATALAALAAAAGALKVGELFGFKTGGALKWLGRGAGLFAAWEATKEVINQAEIYKKETGKDPSENLGEVGKNAISSYVAALGLAVAKMLGVSPDQAADNLENRIKDRRPYPTVAPSYPGPLPGKTFGSWPPARLDVSDIERSLRIQRERMQDPEAPRGRAMHERDQSADAVARAVSESITGKAEITVKVEASPDLIAKVVSQVKSQMPAMSLTGPGSTGRSSPDTYAGRDN